MSKVADFARAAAVVGLTAFVAAEPAMAGATAVPGPLLGVGAPALAAFAAGYYFIRKRRRS